VAGSLAASAARLRLGRVHLGRTQREVLINVALPAHHGDGPGTGSQQRHARKARVQSAAAFLLFEGAAFCSLAALPSRLSIAACTRPNRVPSSASAAIVGCRLRLHWMPSSRRVVSWIARIWRPATKPLVWAVAVAIISSGVTASQRRNRPNRTSPERLLPSARTLTPDWPTSIKRASRSIPADWRRASPNRPREGAWRRLLLSSPAIATRCTHLLACVNRCGQTPPSPSGKGGGVFCLGCDAHRQGGDAVDEVGVDAGGLLLGLHDHPSLQHLFP
jgi:hypothetical protein